MSQNPRTYSVRWTDFEKQLIDFVRENPIIYDVKGDDKLYHVKECNKLWKKFAAKRCCTVGFCKRRWSIIKSAYLKLEPEPKNHLVALSSYKRLKDGRLSFLDHIGSKKGTNVNNTDLDHSQTSSENLDVNNTKTHDLKSYYDSNNPLIVLSDDDDTLEPTNNDSSTNEEQPLFQKIEKRVTDRTNVVDSAMKLISYAEKHTLHEPNPLNSNQVINLSDDYDTMLTKYCCEEQPTSFASRIIAVLKVIKCNNKTFSGYEMGLIKYAEKHPILYETRDHQDDPTRRERVKSLWELFVEAAHFTFTEAKRMKPCCHKDWNRIRLEYFIVRKLEDENKGINLRPPLSKYVEGDLDFLEPMYEYIKKKSFRIYYKGTGSLEDNGYLEACVEINHEYSENNTFHWVLINFVKKNRILYDFRITFVKAGTNHWTRASATRKLWEELAVNLNTSRRDCDVSWSQIKVNYIKYIKNKDMNSLKKLKYLSFLNEVYDFSNAKNHEVKKKKTHVKISTSSFENNPGYSVIRMKKNETISEKKNNDSDADCEFKEKDVGSENFGTHRYALQSAPKIKMNQSDPKGCTIEAESFDNQFSKITEETKSDPFSLLNEFNSKNNNFFKEIGKYVTDHFPENKQKEIRIKSWALVTKLELEMLEED